ncbi:MAG: hypothetical protein NT067_05650 [Candidatus Diapherotrites archaeon]|nr:hypothetical protein [Candidatus Diapherotrites archaeon]
MDSKKWDLVLLLMVFIYILENLAIFLGIYSSPIHGSIFVTQYSAAEFIYLGWLFASVVIILVAAKKGTFLQNWLSKKKE